MINIFTGEFLVHPIPFEMSMEHCSHGCVYCFAQIREKRQRFNIKAFTSQLNRNSWITAKLREGYPVCLSNNTDPFSDNNMKYSESVLEYFKLRCVRCFFQTKGGKEAIDLIKGYGLQSVVYVTITTPSDDISKRIEPNAPVSSERIELVRQLKALGHEVIVGINPLHSSWCDKEALLALCEQLNNIGVYSYVFGPLYIRKHREDKYANRDWCGVDIFGEREFKDMEFFKDAVRTIDALKYKNITYLHPFHTTAFDVCKQVYGGKVLPTIHDFTNTRKEFTYPEWEDWFIKSFAPFFTHDGRIGTNLLAYIFVRSNSTYKRFAKENPRDLRRAARWFFELIVKRLPHIKEHENKYELLKI